MTLSLDCYKCRLLLTVSLILLPEALRAQNICGKVAAGLLCLDQPYEAQTQVTGRVKAGPSVPGAAVMITVNVATPQAATVNADGTFILKKLPALNHFDIVKADQTMPPPDGGGPPPSTGSISVLPAPVTCANVAAGALCLDQPYEGQAKVTGKVIQPAGAPVAGAEVLITVNNAALSFAKIPPGLSPFAISAFPN